MKNFKVEGMGCAACASRVEKAINSIAGVKFCSVNLLTNSACVEGNADPKAIINAVQNAGYGASLIEETSELTITKPQNTVQKLRLIFSIMLLASMYFIRLDFAKCMISLAIILINGKIFISGFKNILHLSPNMDSLVALGSGISFAYNTFLFATKSLLHTHFEGCAMIVTFISAGKFLEEISKGKTTSAISALERLVPKNDEIKPGDVFETKKGNAFIADGTIIEGNTFANESFLTGESEKIFKKEGDKVYASSINLDSDVKCIATSTGSDTMLSKIISHVKEAASTKPHIARIADKAASIFIPAVFAVSILTFALWAWTTSDFQMAITKAISVLVISCPCALGLATPVAIMVSNGAGAENGILFKTAESIETCGKIKIVALDKTGTITKGCTEKPDEIKDDGIEAIEKLKQIGLKVVMITGDRESIAKDIAKKAGIETFYSEVLPEEKEKIVKNLMKDGTTCMIGDGVNDAPALSASNVGFAIGSGTDAAIGSADVVLMRNSLLDAFRAIVLGRKTMRVIKQNLFWAFFYNAIFIPIAAFSHIRPEYCALAMSLSSISVVTNALRLKCAISQKKHANS